MDDGARNALRDKGKVCCPGVSQCIGEFTKGEVVRIYDLQGTEFSRTNIRRR